MLLILILNNNNNNKNLTYTLIHKINHQNGFEINLVENYSQNKQSRHTHICGIINKMIKHFHFKHNLNV